MAVLDDELLRDADEDAQAISFIRQQLPAKLQEVCDDDLLQNIIDTTVDVLANSDILDSKPDADGFVDVNLDIVAQSVIKDLCQTKNTNLSVDEVSFIISAWMDFDECQNED